MSTSRKQMPDKASFAAYQTTRRRSVPTRPTTPMPRSQQERWRERPRRRARHVTPGRPDGVVHAIAGPGPCRCLRAQFEQENRAARVSICATRSNSTTGPVSSLGIGSLTSRVVLQNTTTTCVPIVTRHHRAMMLAPCSASSMLSASLRPGRWPGLRAWTTPPRGTVRQRRDGGAI